MRTWKLRFLKNTCLNVFLFTQKNVLLKQKDFFLNKISKDFLWKQKENPLFFFILMGIPFTSKGNPFISKGNPFASKGYF